MISREMALDASHMVIEHICIPWTYLENMKVSASFRMGPGCHIRTAGLRRYRRLRSGLSLSVSWYINFDWLNA